MLLHGYLVHFLRHSRPTKISTLSLHDALPISGGRHSGRATLTTRPGRIQRTRPGGRGRPGRVWCAECDREIGRAHVELQSLRHLVCRLLLEKKKKKTEQVHTLVSKAQRALTEV